MAPVEEEDAYRQCSNSQLLQFEWYPGVPFFLSSSQKSVSEEEHLTPGTICLPAFWVVKTIAKTWWKFCHLQSKTSGLGSPSSCRANSPRWFFPSSVGLSSLLLFIPFHFSSCPFLHDINTTSWCFLPPSLASVTALFTIMKIPRLTLELLEIPWFLGLRSEKELCMN